MEKIICQKCGNEISKDFRQNFSFCPNCGASVGGLTSDKTKNTNTENKKSKKSLFIGLVLGAFMTTFVIGGLLLFLNVFQSQNENVSGGGQKSSSTPWIKLPGFSSVAASEITEVTFFSWQHSGLLYSGEGSVQSERIIFRRDGSVTQIKEENFDDGKKTDKTTEKSGNISPEQFQRLAESLVENDFFNQTDSTERISESDKSLKIKYSGKEKEIKTSNVGKDTPEIKTTLDVITNLESHVNWNAQN